MWEAAIAEEPDPSFWMGAMGRSYLSAKDKRGHVATLWVQALTDASDDPEIRRFVKRHMREVHQFVADVIRRAQETGGIVRDRDPDAEAPALEPPGSLRRVRDREQVRRAGAARRGHAGLRHAAARP